MSTSTKKDRTKAIIYTIIAATLLSTGGILLKFVDMQPLSIAGLRSIISGLVVLAYLKKPKFTFSKPQMVGALSYATMVIGFTVANKLTTAANAVVLQFTAPVWIALLSAWILRERIRWFDWIAIVFVLSGMVLFFIDDMGGGSTIGNIVAIVSGVALAGNTICLRLQKDGSPVENTLLGHIVTVIVCLPFIFKANLNLQNAIFILILGVFQLGIAYIFYALSMKHLTALESILIMFLEPILNPIWVIIFYGEKPSVFSLIGGVIVLITLGIRSIVSNKYIENPTSS